MSDKIEKKINHPMEQIFNIEEGTTIVTRSEKQGDLVEVKNYDDKDAEIEKQFQEVYDAAMSAFENQEDTIDIAIPKLKARAGEIAVQFLNTALSAAKEKATLKSHKDKLSIEENKEGNVTNNNLIVNRNDLLKMLNDHEEEKIKNITDSADEKEVINGEIINVT